jgi:hypothetical protein
MLRLLPITVESYSGFKADEYPKCFYREDIRYEVLEVVDRWYQGNSDPEIPVSDYFKVAAGDGCEYILKHEILNDKWFLCSDISDKTPYH